MRFLTCESCTEYYQMVEYSCDMPFEILFHQYLFKFPLTFDKPYFIIGTCLFLHRCYLMQECLSANLILSNIDKLTIVVCIQGISEVSS